MKPYELIEHSLVQMDGLTLKYFLVKVSSKQSKELKEFLEANGYKLASNSFIYVCYTIPLVLEVTDYLIKIYPYWRY